LSFLHLLPYFFLAVFLAAGFAAFFAGAFLAVAIFFTSLLASNSIMPVYQAAHRKNRDI